MLSTILTKSLRDRWTTMALAGASVGLMLLGVMAVYSGLDASFYYELPQALLNAVGVNPDIGGLGGIAYGAIFNLLGAMTIAGFAISIGADAIAGEEEAGTLGLLLANPRSRTQVLLAKVAALVGLVALGGLILWGAGHLAPTLLDVDITGVDVFAVALHMSVNALWWGMLALAIGAVTGNRLGAVAGSAGVMVLSWLATSFLPLIESAADAARFFPWYYFNSSQTEANGIDVGHLAVLLGLTLIAVAAGIVGLRRRDLRSGGGTSLIDRLRTNPRAAALIERAGGAARVQGITSKAISDHQGFLAAILALIFYMSLLLTPFYNLLPDTITSVFADLPDAMLAAIGGVDMSTPTGWIQGELFSIVVPIAGIALLASMGAKAIAGEEESHTMGLLLANPISRRRILLAKVAAMGVHATLFGLALFGGTAVGVIIGGLDVSIPNVAAISVLGTLLCLVFGGIALLVGAATGRPRQGVGAAAGIGVLGYAASSFLPLSESLEGFSRLSPFHYYLGSDPLINGMDWGHAGILLGLFAVLVVAAIPLFDRRDLRG